MIILRAISLDDLKPMRASFIETLTHASQYQIENHSNDAIHLKSENPYLCASHRIRLIQKKEAS